MKYFSKVGSTSSALPEEESPVLPVGSDSDDDLCPSSPKRVSSILSDDRDVSSYVGISSITDDEKYRLLVNCYKPPVDLGILSSTVGSSSTHG